MRSRIHPGVGCGGSCFPKCAQTLDLNRALVDEGAQVRAYGPDASERARPFLPPGLVMVINSVAETADPAQALAPITEWGEMVPSDWRVLSRCTPPHRFILGGLPYSATCSGAASG